MQLSLRASTGVKITVWREAEMFNARLSGSEDEVQICLGVDLFEVIADLARLNLDVPTHAEEAVELADYAQSRLSLPGRRQSDERSRYVTEG